jgi:opacity protein-like surface antigen
MIAPPQRRASAKNPTNQTMTNTSVCFTAALCGLLSITQAGTPISEPKSAPPMEAERPIGVGFYAALFGGVNVHQDADLDDFEVEAGGLNFNVDTDLDSDTGWFAGLKLGYVWDTGGVFMPAIELEGFYNTVDVNIDATARSLRTDARVNGELKSGVFMFNLLGKFNLGHFRPYVGAGAGAAYLEGGDIRGSLRFRGEEFASFETDADDIEERTDLEASGWTFAWQAIGGFDVYLTDSVSLFAEYKALWFYADTDELSHYLQHLVGGGIRIHF